MPFAATAITSGPSTVHYDIFGNRDAPAVVLVHGTGGDARQWSHLADHLGDRYRVIAPDLAGSGRTTGTDGPISLEDLAGQVRAVAAHAGVDRYHLLGHSLGATVAASIAATTPQHVDSLILHAGWVRTDAEMTATFEHWLALLAAGGNELLAQAIALQAFGPDYWAEVTDPDAHRLILGQIAPTIAPGTDRLVELDLAIDLTADLPTITAPTLLLHSRHDRIVPPTQRDALSAALPHARVVVLDQGHAAPAIDPAGFAAAVSMFLDSFHPAAHSRG